MTEPTTDATASALASIRAERLRQQEKWGTQRHSWPEWLMILGEEYGECCEAGCTMRWQADYPRYDTLRGELVQLAAVAVAIIEHIDEVQR